MARKVSWAEYDRDNLRGIVTAFLAVVSGDYAEPEISEAELSVRWVGKETLRVTVTKESLQALLDGSGYQLRLEKGKKDTRQQYSDRLQNFFDALRQMAGCHAKNEGRVWKLQLELADTNRDWQRFFQVLDLAWEQAKATYRGESLPDPEEPHQTETASRGKRLPIELEFPNGAVGLNSPFYVPTGKEADCVKVLQKPGALLRIKSPSQRGKSSLLVQVLGQVEPLGYRVARLDFQRANQPFLAEPERFMQWFCQGVGR